MLSGKPKAHQSEGSMVGHVGETMAGETTEFLAIVQYLVDDLISDDQLYFIGHSTVLNGLKDSETDDYFPEGITGDILKLYMLVIRFELGPSYIVGTTMYYPATKNEVGVLRLLGIPSSFAENVRYANGKGAVVLPSAIIVDKDSLKKLAELAIKIKPFCGI